MPGLMQRIGCNGDDNFDIDSAYQNSLLKNGTKPLRSGKGLVSSNVFWSKHLGDLSYNQLEKFWCELTPEARQKLMRIDKQTLFEHARKSMYCSRCNGLLLEAFLQIVMYGKSLQQDAAGGLCNVGSTNEENDDNLCTVNVCQEDSQDPSIQSWGGLTTARDGELTLLDCYLHAKSLKGLQNVFDNARERERERELLYPDACGGGGRGWISQGMAGCGRGHGTRETCALHTARLSVETLMDFWSALGEETRQSLLRMKEEDFVERLMYRFDSKKFCRDCRKNVIREFKELKELKRTHKDPRCTSWFCAADTAFQYEVSHDTVRADWYQTFLDSSAKYHHYEWAIGTGEGNSDITEYEDVGLSSQVQVNGLDLSDLSACYITVRAWKKDGRYNELCVKAHALQGQSCVHCRLVTGDGYVAVTSGESIRRFFEHAEEAEEEEDDDLMDKDENEFDGECSRPQKHAKSPELAREFLLDAATIIFKQQVEKAFREGTARQNVHSVFVSLALKLLEERLHVACKEIITFEKQMKLLEEEENEKREEEERKERRRTKEREKKLRRKERLREKEFKEKKYEELNMDPVVPDASDESTSGCDGNANVSSRDRVNETGEAALASPLSSNFQDDQLIKEDIDANVENHSEYSPDEEIGNTRDWNTSFPYDQFNDPCRKLKFHKDPEEAINLKWSDRKTDAAFSKNGVIPSKHASRFSTDGYEYTRSIGGFHKQVRSSAANSITRNGFLRSGENQCTGDRRGDGYSPNGCSCPHHKEHRSRLEPKYVTKLEPPSNISKPYHRGQNHTQVQGACEINVRYRGKVSAGNPPNARKVWEPLDSQKKYNQSSSNSDVTYGCTPKVDTSESFNATSYNEVKDSSVLTNHEDNNVRDLTNSSSNNCRDGENGFHALVNSRNFSKEAVHKNGELSSSTKSPLTKSYSSTSSPSNSDSFSSCLSDSSNPHNLESASTSDSEESSQISETRENSDCLENEFSQCHNVGEDSCTRTAQDDKMQGPTCAGSNSLSSLRREVAPSSKNGISDIGAQSQTMLPQLHNQSIHYHSFQAPPMGYYHQNPVSWSAVPASGFMPFPYSNHYLFANTSGYGSNGNPQFMQYGALQHLPPPLLNPVHLPVFQPNTQVNGVISKDQPNVTNPGVRKEMQMQNRLETKSLTDYSAAALDNKQNRKSVEMDSGNDGFSLFHFGGPIALSAGYAAGAVTSEGMTEGTSSRPLSKFSDHNNPCTKEDPIEEYNLFATSNSIKFSIF